MRRLLIHGDCLAILPTLSAVDAVVTDPPYGLQFMGKQWDHGVPGPAYWVELLRVAKPGCHLLAFGGTRTYHRLTVAIEDAGWEIRDAVMWVYGNGFPKSALAALKPAWEPIILARKPLAGTVAKNVEVHGTGALNVEACRVGAELVTTCGGNKFPGVYGDFSTCPESTHVGRWPANVIHDGSEEVIEHFPNSKGQLAAVGPRNGDKAAVNAYGEFGPRPQFNPRGDHNGSAARFFYCAKASQSERGEGNTHPTVKPLSLMRYLCRLITPPGGVVLDPFAGSGSTLLAASLEGFGYVGIEKEAAYCDIARRRLQRQEAEAV